MMEHLIGRHHVIRWLVHLGLDARDSHTDTDLIEKCKSVQSIEVNVKTILDDRLHHQCKKARIRLSKKDADALVAKERPSSFPEREKTDHSSDIPAKLSEEQIKEMRDDLKKHKKGRKKKPNECPKRNLPTPMDVSECFSTERNPNGTVDIPVHQETANNPNRTVDIPVDQEIANNPNRTVEIPVDQEATNNFNRTVDISVDQETTNNSNGTVDILVDQEKTNNSNRTVEISVDEETTNISDRTVDIPIDQETINSADRTVDIPFDQETANNPNRTVDISVDLETIHNPGIIFGPENPMNSIKSEMFDEINKEEGKVHIDQNINFEKNTAKDPSKVNAVIDLTLKQKLSVLEYKRIQKERQRLLDASEISVLGQIKQSSSKNRPMEVKKVKKEEPRDEEQKFTPVSAMSSDFLHGPDDSTVTQPQTLEAVEENPEKIFKRNVRDAVNNILHNYYDDGEDNSNKTIKIKDHEEFVSHCEFLSKKFRKLIEEAYVTINGTKLDIEKINVLEYGIDHEIYKFYEDRPIIS